MTDTPTPDDELASAALDGELPPADATRVEADPALRARRDELARAAEAIRAPVTAPDAAARDAAVAAAMAAFPAGSATATVSPLAARRRLVPLAAAAAVLAVLAVGALVVRSTDSGTTVAQSTASTTAQERAASSALDAAASTSGAAGTSGAATGATAASAPAVDLGRYADVESLAAAVRARLTNLEAATAGGATAETYAAPSATTTTSGARCGPPAAVPYPSLVADATLDGAPVQVFVGPDAQDRTLLVILDASCAEVASETL